MPDLQQVLDRLGLKIPHRVAFTVAHADAVCRSKLRQLILPNSHMYMPGETFEHQRFFYHGPMPGLAQHELNERIEPPRV